MAARLLTEPSRVAIEAAFEAALNALVVSPDVDEPRPSQLAYLGVQLLRRAGTRGREAAEELLAESDAAAPSVPTWKMDPAKEAELKEVATECALAAEARAARYLESMVGALHMKVRRQSSPPPTYLAHHPAPPASARAPSHPRTHTRSDGGAGRAERAY